MKCTATIYGTPEQEQSVQLEFEHRSIGKWFSNERSTVFISWCRIKEALKFTPSDIFEDVSVAVAEALGERPEDIRIECDVEHSVKPALPMIVEPLYELEMLFI